MTRAVASIPDETALLCENCGYNLTGLESNSACPECGKPIEDSTPEKRQPARWELVRGTKSFTTTSAQVLLHPTRFFRSLATRGPVDPARQFAKIHWVIASAIFGIALHLHLAYLAGIFSNPKWFDGWLWIILAIATYIALAWTTELAARLTAWEAAFRGLRMPIQAVRRSMYFHAAHYLPAALMVLVTVLVYYWLRWSRWVGFESLLVYLVVLCAEILIGAAYLFKTYWIGMRNIMYANR